MRPMVAIALLTPGCAADFGISDAPSTPTLVEGTELGPDEHEDVWVQTISPTSDVLFVVDNSCSMRDEQLELARNFSTFLDAILVSDTDYHVGVVSTDMVDPDHSGRLRGSDGVLWIDPDTPDPETHFDEMVTLGIDGSTDERGRGAAYAALEIEADGYNAGFLRDASNLHLVVVSDEDDVTDTVDRAEFVQYLRGLKVAPFEVTFSSIVGPEGSTMSPWADCSAQYGLEYLEVTREVGGLEWSICKEDWGPILADLGSVAAGLRTEFYLTRRPVPAWIVVTIEIDGEPQPFEGPTSGWIYDERRNRISIINYVPPDGAVIRVRYRVAT